MHTTIQPKKAVLAVMMFSLLAPIVLADNGLVLSSSVMTDNGTLPEQYGCDGTGVSPPLAWSGVPKGTQSLVVLMDHEAGQDDIHWYWTLYNIPNDVQSVSEGASAGTVGGNSVNPNLAYAPPCSKGSGTKEYTFHLYALSDTLTISSASEVTPMSLRAEMANALLASTSLTVEFERSFASVPGDGDTVASNRDADDRPARPADGENRPPRPEDGNRPPRAEDGNRPPRPEDGDDRSVRADTEQADEGNRTPPERVVIAVPSIKESVDSKACATVQASVSDSGFNAVEVTCDKTHAYLVSDTYPDHELMNGITGTNEQIPVPAAGNAAPIPLAPKMAAEKTSIDAALGIAVNGVPIYDYSAQGDLDLENYNAKMDTLALGQLDVCGGHAGRGDDYHYHAKPVCMINTIENANASTILGWGYDGYPLFGDENPDGSSIKKGALDVCNGQADNSFGYRYHTSDEQPYIFQCLVGEVDTTLLPRVSPMRGAFIRSDLNPPRGGVENLQHNEAADGTRTMTYSYQGEDYYSNFKPSTSDAKCFDFEQRTISNDGAVESGTLCRD
ncbi:YHYH protein [Reinekea sp.]|jgi:Raf kinase inhibitor-like YbhB/YbcL family protein|uniref:YHYH protein n=1 Tax=Reinekea sp. TaxID=1970455 RepID=UPI002A804A8D|nr:YHYH protein [Reinekea sp.]